MSRSASDLLDPNQYETNDPVYYSSALTTSQSSDYCSVGSGIRSSQSSSNLGGFYHAADGVYSASCTSDDDSVANTVYSAYRNDNNGTNGHYRRNNINNSSYSSNSTTESSCGSSHKIALVTNDAPHVNNIVVSATEKRRDEQDALCRLDELSCSNITVS